MSIDKHGFLGSQMENWIKDCRARHSPYFALADEVNEFCQASMYEFQVHNADLREMLTASLYIRVLSNYQSVIVLCERGMMPEARTILRAMLEAIFNLCAVAKDPLLARDFVLEDQEQRRKFLNKFRMLHGGRLPPTVNAQEIEELERQLKAEGKIEVRNVEEWAREAGLHPWYLTAYAVLSGSVHSRVRDLERYLVTDEKGNVTEFKWGPSDEELKDHIATAISAILQALYCAAALFNLEKKDDIEKFGQRLRQLHPLPQPQ